MTCPKCNGTDLTQDFSTTYYPAGEPEKYWACKSCRNVFYLEQTKDGKPGNNYQIDVK